jgi:hypothetical protein
VYVASDTSMPEHPDAIEKLARAIDPSMTSVGPTTAAFPDGHVATIFGTPIVDAAEHIALPVVTLRAALKVVSVAWRENVWLSGTPLDARGTGVTPHDRKPTTVMATGREAGGRRGRRRARVGTRTGRPSCR